MTHDIMKSDAYMRVWTSYYTHVFAGHVITSPKGFSGGFDGLIAGMGSDRGVSSTVSAIIWLAAVASIVTPLSGVSTVNNPETAWETV